MKLTIAFFNDVHGYLQPHSELFYEGSKEVVETVGGYARIAGYINEARKNNEHVLVFDGGDTFHGTYPVVHSKGEIVVPILDRIGIDAMVGHWDFAYGPEQLLHLASQLGYPVLGINVYREDGSLFLSPYKMVKISDTKIAIIGICSYIIDKTMPSRFSEGLRISDGSDELPGYIEKVKNEGASIIILLSHNGLPQDCFLLSKIKGVDICLSAHTHNRLYQEIVIGNSILVQCGCHGSFIGHLEIETENNKIIQHRYTLKTVDQSFPVDENVEEFVKAALQPHLSLLSKSVGRTSCILHRYNILNSKMDNLLLAAMMNETDTELAFSNGWRYGTPIAAGEIAMNDLFNIIPHNPFISTIELKGEEIKQMLEENLERTFSSHPMDQMGGYVKRCMGLTAYIKIENAKGHRIQELFIGKEHYRKKMIYRASFVTEQGVPQKYGSNRSETTSKAIEAMINYLKRSSFDVEMAERKAFIPV